MKESCDSGGGGYRVGVVVWWWCLVVVRLKVLMVDGEDSLIKPNPNRKGSRVISQSKLTPLVPKWT